MIRLSKYRKCPICLTSRPILFLPATSAAPKVASQIQVTEKYFGLHGDMVMCPNCNFVYIGKKLLVSKIAGLYKKMSDAVYIQEEKERRLSFVSIIKTLEKIRRGGRGKILDIGCCTGGLLFEAEKRGWKPSGIDPSVWAYKMAQKLHGLTIFNGTLETYNYSEKNFDAVTLLDVFEHTSDPKFVLTKIRTMLNENGVFCLVTPDFGSITAKILGKRWWGIRLAHVSYFRWIDLSRLFADTGFKVIQKKPYIRFFSLYYILVRILPFIEKNQMVKSFLKKITIPLIFFDTFEVYLVKN